MSTHGNMRECFARAATGFAMTDVHGKVIHANETLARIVDRTPADIGQANLFELTHPEDLSRHREMLKKLLDGEVPGFVIEKRYLRPDGTAVWVRNSVCLAEGEEAGSPRNVISICEDINQHKNAVRVLEKQEQMAAIGRLTSSIVHEINNPLEAVLNLLFLARRSADAPSAEKFLKEAEEELSRVSEITMRALQFHRQPPSPVSADMVEILQSVLALFKGKFKLAGVQVEIKTEDKPQLICFAGEIRQVFVNLIANAVESMPDGGRLIVRVRPGVDWRTDQPGVRITIADTGYGMSAETREHIYQAFYTTKGSEGSGLGLWVTANIVRKHAGNIHVRSRRHPEGGGTVFSLVFPRTGAAGTNSDIRNHAA
jgi:PAS domain S-box-containing protein